jgi:hypothetical protein
LSRRDRRQTNAEDQGHLARRGGGGGPILDYVVKNNADKLRSDLIIVDGGSTPAVAYVV